MSDSKGFKQLMIANDAKLQLIHNPKTEREIIYLNQLLTKVEQNCI